MIKSSVEIIRKAGAATILSSLIIPWLVAGTIHIYTKDKDNSERHAEFDKDIAVMKNEEKNILHTLEKMDKKLDVIILRRR